MKIEDLGLSTNELKELVIERAVERLLIRTELDEYGDEHERPSRIDADVKKLVKQRIDERVAELGEKHILPNVTQAIESVTIQKTNEWGEAKGDQLTFVEYLVSRAEAYMTEPVNHEGKSKSESNSSFNWRQADTRMTHAIDKHLKYSIDSAMKKILTDANKTLEQSIKTAVEIKLKEITNGIKVSVGR